MRFLLHNYINNVKLAEKQTIEGKNLSSLIDRIKKATGLNQEQIAKKVDYEREYLSQAKKTGSDALYFKLENKFKKELENSHILEAEKELNKTGKQPFHKQLHEQKLNGIKENTIPYYGEPIAVGGTNYSADMTAITQPTDRLDIGDVLRDSQCAMQVFSNSMTPNYPPGCIVGLIKKENKIIEPGRVYVIETVDDRIIKRLYPSIENKLSAFLCVSDNSMKWESGPMAGQYFYPPFEIAFEDIVRLYAVTGVVKRNRSSMIVNNQEFTPPANA